MQKTRIEIRADIAVHAIAHKAAQLVVDNWRNETTDMANSNGEAEIDPTNVELVKYGVYTKMFLTDNIRKTCRK